MLISKKKTIRFIYWDQNPTECGWCGSCCTQSPGKLLPWKPKNIHRTTSAQQLMWKSKIGLHISRHVFTLHVFNPRVCCPSSHYLMGHNQGSASISIYTQSCGVKYWSSVGFTDPVAVATSFRLFPLHCKSEDCVYTPLRLASFCLLVLSSRLCTTVSECISDCDWLRSASCWTALCKLPAHEAYYFPVQTLNTPIPRKYHIVKNKWSDSSALSHQWEDLLC